MSKPSPARDRRTNGFSDTASVKKRGSLRIRLARMNRFSALGSAEILRAAGCGRGKELSCLRRASRNTALRKFLLLPLDDLLSVVREVLNPHASRTDACAGMAWATCGRRALP